MQRLLHATLVVVLAAGATYAAPADGPSPGVATFLARMHAVGSEGVGNEQAAAAWRELASADVQQLPTILAGLDTANPLAANWISTAIDSVAQRAVAQGRKLPSEGLESFVRQTQHNPRARRLAYEWLLQADPSAQQRLIPAMLNDPSLELRREAVAQAIEEAAALDQANQHDAAQQSFQRAWEAARDVDQVRQLAGRLRKAGASPDIARHFGFLVRWHLIGPFNNVGRQGFVRVYPPEQALDLAAKYDGKHGQVRWVPWTSHDDYGVIDVNKALVEEKEVTAYATTEFVAPRSQEVQFRLTSYNASKTWLNGRLIAQHEVYHGGSQLDQYIDPARLKAGRNVILIKICQNEQTQDWAKFWAFQLRVCDPIGTAILSEDRDPPSNPPARREGRS